MKSDNMLVSGDGINFNSAQATTITADDAAKVTATDISIKYV
jgi:hypothetical protein